jgi:tetratricopeptide (TPR) repeat protein
MRQIVCAFCLGILVTCASWTAVASDKVAGDKEEAKQLFESGLKLMRVDDFAGASATFERSIALYPTQNSLFNLANCYRAMQRYGEALATIERLKRDFADKLKPEIKASVDRQQIEIQLLVAPLTLETDPADTTVTIDGKPVGAGPKLGPLLLEPGEHTIETARPDHRSQRRTVKLEPGLSRNEKFVLEIETGNIIVRATPEGAVVFLDGKQIGTTPLADAVSMAVGKHVLALHASDREDFERAIDVRPGDRQILDIVLIAKPTPVLAPQPQPPPQAPAVLLATTEPSTPKSRTLKIVTWSSLAGAVAAAAVAGTYLVILSGQHNDFQNYNDLYAQYGRTQDDAKRRAVLDDMHSSSSIAIVCGIGAGALATTALVTYLVDSGSKAGESSVALSPTGIGVRF